jgi:hypothetical protein
VKKDKEIVAKFPCTNRGNIWRSAREQEARGEKVDVSVKRKG